MKKLIVGMLFLLFQTVGFAQVLNSGDNELDQSLKSINANAQANFKVFKKDLSVAFNIDEGKLDKLMVSYGMQPSDLYMCLEIGRQAGKNVDEVAESFNKNKGKGWGVIAKEMGIKPGSPEFHALKNNAKGKNDKMKNKNKGKGNAGNKGNGQGKGKKK